jgi:hypothetical protein
MRFERKTYWDLATIKIYLVWWIAGNAADLLFIENYIVITVLLLSISGQDGILSMYLLYLPDYSG